MNNEKIYEAPQVEMFEVEVEKGFASSPFDPFKPGEQGGAGVGSGTGDGID